jgi:hypothetical protein
MRSRFILFFPALTIRLPPDASPKVQKATIFSESAGIDGCCHCDAAFSGDAAHKLTYFLLKYLKNNNLFSI